MSCEIEIPDDPGIVDQDIDRANGGFNLPDARGAGFKVARVPAIHSSACFGSEGFCGGIIAGIGRSDTIPGFGSASEMAAPMPRVPPVTSAIRAIFFL